MPLKVFVVWFNMLPSDDRRFLDTSVLADSRVSNYWDEHKLFGTWVSQQMTHSRGITWDAFFLFGPQARWDNVPQPVVSEGGPVIGSTDELAAGLQQLTNGALALPATDAASAQS